jgi:hypothetical protein
VGADPIDDVMPTAFALAKGGLSARARRRQILRRNEPRIPVSLRLETIESSFAFG